MSRQGRYLVFPDSAEPLPQSIWERATPEALEREVEWVNQRLAELPESANPWGYGYVSPEQAAFLESLGEAGLKLMATIQGRE